MPEPDRKERELGCIRAIWDALTSSGSNFSHYPRFVFGGQEQRVADGDLIGKIARALGAATFDKQKLGDDWKLARESLDEVKALTEYEDQKATRLLTIVTIFGALAGLIFNRLADAYPIRPVICEHGITSLPSILVLTNYVLFLAFVLLAVSGALVTFHATRIRFKYPSLVPGMADEAPKPAKSYLFYKEIIQLPPEHWARAFLTRDGSAEQTSVRNDLSSEYFKNYVVETYLVAAKVADKLRYLTPAQELLSWSLKTLLIWIIICAITFAVVPSQSRATSRSTFNEHSLPADWPVSFREAGVVS